MAWTLLDSGVLAFADGGSGKVFTYPGGAPANGNLLILAVNSDTTVSTPAGWTAVKTDVANQGAYLFTKVASSEGTTVTVTTTGDHNAALSYLRYSGQAVSALDVTVATRAGPGTTSSAVAPSALAETGELCLLFGMLHNYVTSTPPSAPVAGSGYTVLLDTGVAGAAGAPSAAAHYVIGRTDGSGSQTPTVSWSGSGFWDLTSIFVAFKADAAPAQTITPTGIASAEAFGTAQINQGITGNGIESGEAFGTPVIRAPQMFAPAIVTEYWQSPDAFRPYSSGNRLRYRIGIAASVVRVAGVWATVYDPSEDLVASADRVYVGGHRYAVTADEAELLIAAGYGDYLTLGA